MTVLMMKLALHLVTTLGLLWLNASILMSVPRTLTTALRIALTLLVATSVSAMMDTLWTLTNTLAMISMSVRQGTTRVMPIHNAPILMVDMSVNASLVLMEMA
jgi:hypothetical protein